MSETAPFLLASLPPWPNQDFSEFGEIEAAPLNRIQQLTGAFLGRNWVAVPHVTHHDEIDVTDFELRRIAWNEANASHKITALVPLIKAVVAGLQAFPRFNASLDASGKNLVLKKYFHIGVAVDAANGLVVPVIRDCERKSMDAIAAQLKTLSEKARSKGLSMAEMSGGCLTISSLGHIGGTAFTPIVNAPEVAILGVARLQTRAAPGPGGSVAWRQVLPISLSYDHRVINGADAARFVRTVGEALAGTTSFA